MGRLLIVNLTESESRHRSGRGLKRSEDMVSIRTLSNCLTTRALDVAGRVQYPARRGGVNCEVQHWSCCTARRARSGFSSDRAFVAGRLGGGRLRPAYRPADAERRALRQRLTALVAFRVAVGRQWVFPCAASAASTAP